LIQSAGSLFLCGPGPAFQPALLQAFTLNPGLMADQPQQREIGICLSLHHGFEVEFHISMAREAGIVTQDAQPQAVRDKSPQVSIRTIQEFLDQAMRACLSRTCHASGSAIQIHPATDQVNGDIAPLMGDRVFLALYFNGLAGAETTVAKFLKQGQKPPFARGGCGGIAIGEIGNCRPKGGPGSQKVVPGFVDCLVQSSFSGQMVIFRAKPFERTVVCGDFLK